ncbi:MAG: RDD family protein [Gammaproteobacteria bacterium]|nr:RDD family protein [Gammaproteobacteria bacterium]MCI0591312.1 RDD family protein [Gammaproteobacteria bacterium]
MSKTRKAHLYRQFKAHCQPCLWDRIHATATGGGAATALGRDALGGPAAIRRVVFRDTFAPALDAGGQTIRAPHPIYAAYLLSVGFLYYGWQRTRGGQTLDMRAWPIHLKQEDGKTVSWRRAALCFVCAIPSGLFLGLAVLCSIWDHHKLAWHDRASGTILVIIGPTVSDAHD